MYAYESPTMKKLHKYRNKLSKMSIEKRREEINKAVKKFINITGARLIQTGIPEVFALM